MLNPLWRYQRGKTTLKDVMVICGENSSKNHGNMNPSIFCKIGLIHFQSMFTALNIEPESDTEDEVDNTKEIQVSPKTCSTSPSFICELDRRSLETLPERFEVTLPGSPVLRPS